MTDMLDQQVLDLSRRRFLAGSSATAALAVAGTVTTSGVAMASARPAGGFGTLKRVVAGDLSIAYAELGAPHGRPVLLFHGWPYDIRSFADAAAMLAARGYTVYIPYLRGHGETRFRSDATPRNAQQVALATDAIVFMDAIGLESAVIGGFDWGARTADIVAALWPERCMALVSVSGYLIGSQHANVAPLSPEAEHAWWYQFYFATDRGRAGYAANTRAFNRLIWQLASPQWHFDDATFEESAVAFDNPDHAAIVIHNYRWRLGLADGEQRYDALEAQLASGPSISVPTITMEGDANGAPHPEPASYRTKFTGPYQHRTLTGGIGHNLPQEAPAAFAQAIIDADGM